MKKLMLLLKLRAWLKSGTLKAGGVVAALGALQTWFATQDGTDLLNYLATLAGLSGATLNGIVLGLIGLAMLGLRAKTEWSLAEKVDGADKG